MTMQTIKTYTTSVTEVQLKIPSFRKSGSHYVKILSENSSMVIKNVIGEYIAIDVNPFILNSFFEVGSVEITEEEFLEKYNEVTNLLNQLTTKNKTENEQSTTNN